MLLLDTGNVRKGTARIGKGPGLENGAGPRRDGLRPANLFSPGAFPFLALALQKTILLASPVPWLCWFLGNRPGSGPASPEVSL